MKKPNYTFEDKVFSPIKDAIIKNELEHKRCKLEINLNRDNNDKGERCLVILKNPSRAGLTDINESDKTVNTVCQYLYDKTDVINAKTVVIMNLFPVYGTDSKELHTLESKCLLDNTNKKYLDEEIKKADKIIVAWGTHPLKCKIPFEEMRNFVLELLKNKKCYQMKHPIFKLNPKRPLHGQVWGYENYDLVEFV